MYFAGRVSVLFFRAIFFIIFLIKRCNDDVILSTKLVESSGVLLINKELFFEFEFELVFSIRLNLHVGLTILNEFYYSSLLRRWLVILVICIYLLQLSHDPNSLIPSIKKLVVIFIYPSLLIGTNFFLGYTYLSLALLLRSCYMSHADHRLWVMLDHTSTRHQPRTCTNMCLHEE